MHEHDEDDNVSNFQSLSSQFDRSLSSPTEAMSLPSNIEVCLCSLSIERNWKVGTVLVK